MTKHTDMGVTSLLQSPPPHAKTPSAEESGLGMNIHEAMKAVVAGHRIAKISWPEGWYGYMKNEVIMLHKPTGTEHGWQLQQGDIEGDDWHIVPQEAKA